MSKSQHHSQQRGSQSHAQPQTASNSLVYQNGNVCRETQPLFHFNFRYISFLFNQFSPFIRIGPNGVHSLSELLTAQT